MANQSDSCSFTVTLNPVGPCENLPSGMVGWWRGENNALDSMGTHHGTLKNGAVFGSGLVGNSFVFDGVDDYVEVPSSDVVQPRTALTIEGWVYADGTQAGQAGIVGTWDDNSGANRTFLFWLLDGRLSLYISPDGGSYRDATDPTPLPVNRWVHVAGTYDGATIRVFRDGVEVVSVPYSATISANNRPFTIGRTEGGSNGSDYWKGAIDELSLYDHALSASEIAAIHAAASAGKCNSPTPATLIVRGSVWNYLDNGSDQGIAWRGLNFDDSGWAFGPAQLGYGDGDEVTVISRGPNAPSASITTYFRHKFTVPDAQSIRNLLLRVLRDDGAIVYLNGQEIWRSNMPAGPITYLTSAVAALSGLAETTFIALTLPNASYLVGGENVVAVEIHQSGITSSDVSFDLELHANATCAQIDAVPPVLTCPTPMLQVTSSPVGKVVTFTVTATDDCDTPPTVTCDPPGGSLFQHRSTRPKSFGWQWPPVRPRPSPASVDHALRRVWHPVV